MIRHNALTIGGVSTSSFPFKVLVEEGPTYGVSDSKTKLLEHDGLSGALFQSNRQRGLMKLTYTLYLVKPTEEQVYQFISLFTREGFWLEREQVKTTKLWCYKVENLSSQKDKLGVMTVTVTFICHPTKFFKTLDRQTFNGNGTLRLQGSALAFPKITISGSSTGETRFTIGGQVIGLLRLSETLVMENNPQQPSFLTSRGQAVQWSGDFITLDPSQGNSVGVVLGPGISSLVIEIVWGWA
ncbi:phage tail protein [Streptococcus pluranimalium]|uniref:phage tail protein n=1 Tax=Streptococcus pluranimalium TaxID=82348 RepID=UPI0031396095